MKKIPLLLLAAVLMLACASLPFGATPTPLPTATSTPTATFTPSPTSTPTPTPTLTPTPTATIAPPEAPEAGYSNVYGRLLWRGRPVEGMLMSLINSSGGDVNDVFWTNVNTDAEGRFVFTRVPPGDGYILEVNLGTLNTSDLAGQAGAIPVTISVPPDSNFNYGEFYLIETDLRLLAPQRDVVLYHAPDSLRWEPYPGAAYYRVELKQVRGTYTDLEVDTDQTHVDLEAPLLRCIYGWEVTAYDPAGLPLARSDNAFDESDSGFYEQYDGIFRIENDGLPSCLIELYSPAPREHITGGRVEFRWEPHPMAVSYRLSIIKDTGSWSAGASTYTYRCNGLSSDPWGIIGCDGDRVSQTVNGVTTNYVLDQASGLTQVLDDGTYTYLYGNGRIAQLETGTLNTDYFLGDALDSVRQLTDAAGAVTYAAAYAPYGEVAQAYGSGPSYGFTGEMADSYTGMVYLRARYYSPAIGRFINRDLLKLENPFAYARSNPVNRTDPSGYISESDSFRADQIWQELIATYGVTIKKDWGYSMVPIPTWNVPNSIGIPNSCTWTPGRWDIIELEIVRYSIERMNAAMGGRFRVLVGSNTIEKISSTNCFDPQTGKDARACTTGSLIQIWDRGMLPNNPDMQTNIYNPNINADAWSIVHELAHVWNNTLSGQYSIGLEAYTRGMTQGQATSPNSCDPLGALPGCNDDGYVYRGIPATGTRRGFNRSEDFSESVAAYVFPEVLATKKSNMFADYNQRLLSQGVSGRDLSYWNTQYQQYLSFGLNRNYAETSRWYYVNGVINGTIDPYNP